MNFKQNFMTPLKKSGAPGPNGHDGSGSKELENNSGEPDSVKINIRVEFICQIFYATFIAVYATLSNK